jgi:hypothetical protein
MRIVKDTGTGICYIQIEPEDVQDLLDKLLDLLDKDEQHYFCSEKQLLLLQSFTAAIDINIHKPISIKLNQEDVDNLQEIISTYESLAS